MKNSKLFFILIVASTSSCNPQGRHSDHGSSESATISDIVVVNLGLSNRIGISKQISIINSLKPHVIAIDIEFSEQVNSYQDSLLISTLNNCENLVMASHIVGYKGKDRVNYDSISGSLPVFLNNAKIGFINVIFENDQTETVRTFSIYEKVNQLTMYHFAVRTAMSYDSLKTMKFVNENPRISEINYLGNKDLFETFSYNDILQYKVPPEKIRGKIVLFGYLGPYEGYDKQNDLDKFFSPLQTGVGANQPDMYGAIILANIISQVLELRPQERR